jgi:S-adenosylmethionine-dependent methyltransferase
MQKAPKPPADKSFDNRAELFKKKIYGTTKGKIRASVVWRDLEEILKSLPTDRPLNILDAGGGFGFMAKKLAHLGHKVTVVDISNDMIELGRKELLDDPVSGELCFMQGTVQELPTILPNKKYDLVMCHAVLEWLIDPKPVIAILKSMLAVNGILSLLIYNKTALFFQSLVVGNFDYIKVGLVKRRRQTLTPQTPLYIDDVISWLSESGLQLENLSGVRVVHDYMRDKQDQINKFDDLLHYELEYSRHPDFARLGRYVHLWTKPFVTVD